ncbi:hypothetical protein CEP53_014910 [Fusarium sp. AF-6]|nr:hypothetical protein CEP53_014910 [Fusarium sp. AF-6]
MQENGSKQQPEVFHPDPEEGLADSKSRVEDSIDPSPGASESCSSSLDIICRPQSPHVHFSDKVQTFIIGGSDGVSDDLEQPRDRGMDHTKGTRPRTSPAFRLKWLRFPTKRGHEYLKTHLIVALAAFTILLLIFLLYVIIRFLHANPPSS